MTMILLNFQSVLPATPPTIWHYLNNDSLVPKYTAPARLKAFYMRFQRHDWLVISETPIIRSQDTLIL